MTSIGMRSLFVIAGIAALVTVGCGKGSPLSASGSPGSIIGPTLLMADGEIDPAAASASGEFATLGKGGDGKGEKEKKDKGVAEADDDDAEEKGKKDKGSKDADEDDDGPGHRGRGSLSGFVTAVGANTITVRGVVITVASTTVIRHGNRSLKLSDITVGDHVQVKGTSTTTATGTTFTATEIKVEDMDGDDDDDDGVPNAAKVEGKISGLTATTGCPVLTFNVVSGTTTTTTTKVTTTATTKFDGVLCTALANDKVVEVKGTKQTDGSIVATKVEID